MTGAMSHTRKSFRRNKGLALVMLGFGLFMILPDMASALRETRGWRNLLHRTPFYEVTVITVWVENPTDLALVGTMKKRRCQFRSVSAYVTYDNGDTLLSIVDTSREATLRQIGDRPPGPFAQLWGPWVIHARVQPMTWETWTERKPLRWQLFMTHICPETGPNTNLFAEGPWP